MVCGRSFEYWKKTIDGILFKGRKYRDLSFSASALAVALGVGGSTLSKILQACYGCGYNDLVNIRRVNDACELLTDSQQSARSVDEIGLLVGFRNRQSFFTAFKKYRDTTPQKYRKLQQK